MGPGIAERLLRFFALLLLPPLLLAPAGARAASCFAAVADGPPALRPAAFRTAAAGEVDLTFLGHASFLIESPSGVTIVTDYNGFNRPRFTPDIVTMNHAHSTHYTDHPDPGIKLVLRGWESEGGAAYHDFKYGDVRIRNVPTNIREGAFGTEFGGNSIFVFDVADLCIAHLGHLHHTLTREHLAALGQVDVLLVPIDGAYTMSQTDMIEVIDEIRPALIVPMHYFGPAVLDRFIGRTAGRWPVRESASPHVTLSRDRLPKSPEILVLPGS
jgi:L-ascorbate metabolism protein UlaG (beta-lactamase superfamily)